MTRPNPFALMIHSRKFWTFFITALSNLVIYFVTKYLSPSSVEDVKMVLGFLDGLAAIYIGSIAWEDASLNEGLNNPQAPQAPQVLH
jgi:hypothetical protein